jgi:thymidylate kinase
MSGNALPSDRPLRVALVGIDGAGKTSVAHRLRERAGGDLRLAVLHAIRPHEAPDAPLHALSRHLQTVSEEADRLRSPELKVAVFYLVLCLYAPVERFFVDIFSPNIVVTDRHPLVDTLVYLPLYGRYAATHPDPDRRPPAAWMDGIDGRARDAAVAWARRTGGDGDLLSLGRQILALHARPPARMLREFRRRYRTDLPDRIVLLDLDVDQAMQRLSGRDRPAQPHETHTQLTAVRCAYSETLAWLASGPAAVDVRRVCTAGRSIDAAVDEIVAGLPVPESLAI